MQPMSRFATIALFLTFTAGAAIADGSGARVAALCASCHRLDGGDNGAPPIIGLDATKFIRKMHAFRSEDTENPTMRTVSKSLTEGEIAAVAEFLAARGKEAKSP